MRKKNIPEKIFIEQQRLLAEPFFKMGFNLDIGIQIKMMRSQLNMSQEVLSKRAKIPRPTISHIERGKMNPSIHLLKKLLEAMFCDLLLVCVPRKSATVIKERRAKKIALKRAEYVRGTMSLEDQTPDNMLIEELVKENMAKILESNDLWCDDE